MIYSVIRPCIVHGEYNITTTKYSTHTEVHTNCDRVQAPILVVIYIYIAYRDTSVVNTFLPSNLHYIFSVILNDNTNNGYQIKSAC